MVTGQARQEREDDVKTLSSERCLQLLRRHEVGRLAVVATNGQPLIFPVNYAFDEGKIVFRTARGTKEQLATQSLVAFETDGWDASRSSGWSVLVQGVAHDVTFAADAPSTRLRRLEVRPMAPGEHARWIGIWANEITGRYF
jgi:nitroimidazol reductase NimA-like FMN-containing flavoprotein (pyridoxamine 5'-phosphate oxidase superfamily)